MIYSGAAEQQSGSQNGDPGQQIQRYHDIPPIGSVRENAPQWSQHNSRNGRQRQNARKNCGGTRYLQHIHGKGEFQYKIPEQRTDLPQNKHHKISGKQFFFHLLSPFHTFRTNVYS